MSPEVHAVSPCILVWVKVYVFYSLNYHAVHGPGKVMGREAGWDMGHHTFLADSEILVRASESTVYFPHSGRAEKRLKAESRTNG